MFEILFQSKSVLFLAALAVELLALWLLARAGRVLRPAASRRRLVIGGALLLHGVPLLFLAWRWMNGSIFYGAVTDGGTIATLFGMHALGGGLLISAQYVAWVLPVLLLHALLARVAGERFRSIVAGLSLSLFAVLCAAVPWRMLHDATSITVDRVSLHAPALHTGRTLRVAVLSDMQLDPYTTAPRVREYFALAEAEHPDIILIAGDVVTGMDGMTPVQEAADLCATLHAPLGVYAVLGDHEIWAGRGKTKVPPILRRAGITVLDDSVARVAVGGDSLVIAGLTNLTDSRATEASINGLLDGTPRGKTILLTHQPGLESLRAAAAHGVRLVTAGHTHGGQVAVSLYGWVLSSVRFGSRYVAGFYDDDPLVYVCSGLGYSVLPFRHLATPSLGIIDILP
jgi:predicted MPP superfamily phosphohydrolase